MRRIATKQYCNPNWIMRSAGQAPGRRCVFRTSAWAGRRRLPWMQVLLFGFLLLSGVPQAFSEGISHNLQPHQQPQLQSAAAADVLEQVTSHGRSLKQLGYDPYGYGYYDPYQAGITPGLVNVDINRETGLHVDVGTVAVDVSADKNYYGVGIGQLVGLGAAKDRGWNLQVGGGNIVDVSATKDAGLGLWLLNGLLNLNIGPNMSGWETNNIAARSLPAQPATVSAATAAAAGAAQPKEVTTVVVDDPTASGSSGSSSAQATAGGDVSAASLPSSHAMPASPEAVAAAAAQQEEPIITEEPIVLPLDGSSTGAEHAAGAAAAQHMRTSAAIAQHRRASAAALHHRAPSYVLPRPAAPLGAGNPTRPVAPQQTTAAAQEADVPTRQQWAQHMGPMVPQQQQQLQQQQQQQEEEPPQQQQQQWPAGPMTAGNGDPAAQAITAAGGGRKACQGGIMVAIHGNKYRCRYKRSVLQGTQAPSAPN